MIAVPLIILAAAAARSDVPAKTSLFLKCQVHASNEAAMHEINVAYFSQPPTDTHGFNLRDPDHLMPLSGRPALANAWPTATLVTFDDAVSGARIAAMAFQPIWGAVGRATVALDRVAPSQDMPSHFSGECGYTEGDAAEREFRELPE